MSSMMEATSSMDQGAQQGGVAQFPTQTRRIKRIGGRPITFDGSELGMAMSYSASVPYWYEINLYRTSDQRFVTTVRLFFISDKEEDRVQGWDCGDLDEAIEKLIQYDAARDVDLGMGLDPSKATPAELAAYAMDLRAQVADRRQHYKSLVGEFLYELDGGQ
ncbi:hypothetical protein [Sulfitobacter sp. JB4-11]|uniref:hypothetical protein n=1 Tax=Sulfitobacter rhodophyticola TaxID=3238304 RepID=UPI0035169519